MVDGVHQQADGRRVQVVEGRGDGGDELDLTALRGGDPLSTAAGTGVGAGVRAGVGAGIGVGQAAAVRGVRAHQGLRTPQRDGALGDRRAAGAQGEACRLGPPTRDAALDVGAREPDLVVEPQACAQLTADPAGVGEAFPPLLAEPRRFVGPGAETRPGRRQVDHHEIVDAAVGEPAHLPGETLAGDLRTRPPPQRRGAEVPGRILEQLLQGRRDHDCGPSEFGPDTFTDLKNVLHALHRRQAAASAPDIRRRPHGPGVSRGCAQEVLL